MTSAKIGGRQSGRQQDTRRTGRTQRYLHTCFISNELLVPLGPFAPSVKEWVAGRKAYVLHRIMKSRSQISDGKAPEPETRAHEGRLQHFSLSSLMQVHVSKYMCSLYMTTKI